MSVAAGVRSMTKRITWHRSLELSGAGGDIAHTPRGSHSKQLSCSQRGHASTGHLQRQASSGAAGGFAATRGRHVSESSLQLGPIGRGGLLDLLVVHDADARLDR